MEASELTLRSLLLPALDLDRSLDFYRDSVGLPVRLRDGDRYAELDAGGLKFSLATPADHPLSATVLPTFKTGDVAAAVSRLVADGAVVVAPPAAGAHEIRAVLRDPAGNAFVVYSSS